MFMQSKDDNLLLQIGGLIHSIIISIPEELKCKVACIFGGIV